MFSHEIPSDVQGYEYFASSEIQLINAIKVGDTEGVMRLLDSIFLHNFKSRNISIEVARCLFFDMTSTAIRVLNSVNIDLRLIFGDSARPVAMILECKTVDEIQSTLKAIYREISDYIRQKKTDHNEALKEKLIAYINGCYMEPTLNLVGLSDIFDINASYLSTFFKQKIGKNFAEYVTELRIEKAKELLLNSTLSLAVIAERVGYTSSGGLIRNFKKLQGITPGQYRSGFMEQR